MIEVRLFGQFDIRRDGSRVDIPTLPARFLFAYLLLNQNVPQSREKLAALFWPDTSDSNGRTSLRQAKWRVNKAFEALDPNGAPILVGDQTISINPQAAIWLDTAVLNTPAVEADELMAAVSVYEGDLLPESFDDWAAAERETYRVLFAQKMQQLLDILVADMRWSDVIPWAERWITLGETPEPAYRALMLAHAGLGDISQVAIVYRRCKEALRRELGVEPSQQTTALRDRLVRGESSLTRGYDLRELIGESAAGEVYRAYQPALGREVAVKVIAPRFANLPVFIRRFESEAQLIARLEHIHILPLYDYWRDPGGAYLVMRWLNGGNLSSVLQKGTLSPSAALRLLVQAAAALASAHQRGVVHGRLKPDNILFDEEGNAYLTDFGIALDGVAGNGSTAASAYQAPEEARGQRPTALSDQYSLALILYQALSGRSSFGSAGDLPLPAAQARLANQVFEQALAGDPEQRFADILALAAALRPALAGDAAPEVQAVIANPYKGLRAFQEADAADFYGREALVQRILDRLREPDPAGRFLALVGPSGSGKSSVIHAGLLPALRQGALAGSANWYVLELSPSADPLADLEVDLLHIAARRPPALGVLLREDDLGLLKAVQQVMPDPGSEVLLIIDHFEQLFTLPENRAEVDHFLDLLAAAVLEPQSTLRVVVALRADFYDRPLLHMAFGDLVRRRTEVITPMSSGELWEAVVSPAERAGLSLEPGLPTAIVSEVRKQPSALPLFQYALTELFEHREGRLLTHAAYEAIGGVAGALARRAEALYGSLTSQEREAARQLFLRLAGPDDAGGETLRRVPLSELASMTAATAVVEAADTDLWQGWRLDEAGIPTDSPPDLHEVQVDPAVVSVVLEAFGRSRLLTFDHDPATREPTVTIAHDALLREWERLPSWLDESRSDLRMRRLLANGAREWLDSGRDPSYLLSGSRLNQLQYWAEETTLVLNQDEQAFLDASIAQRARQLEDENRRSSLILEQVRQRRRRERALVAIGLTALLLTFAAAALARVSRAQARAAISAQLAGACLDGRRGQLDLALLLCLEAQRFGQTFEARDALATVFAENPYFNRTLRGHRSGVTTLAFSPDSSRLASTSADGAAYLWDTSPSLGVSMAGATPLGFDQVNAQGDAQSAADLGQPRDASFGGGNTVLASAGADGRVILRQVDGGGPYQLPNLAEDITSLAVSADGRTLALGSASGRILLWDIAAQRPTGVELQEHSGPVEVLAFNPSGTSLASGGLDGAIRVWDLLWGTSSPIVEPAPASGAETTSGAARGHIPLDLAFSPNGRFLASSIADGTLLLSDLESDEVATRLLEVGRRADALAFSPDGGRLASGFVDGTVTLWDVASGLPLVEDLIGHSGAIKDLVFSPDGRLLASGSEDRTINLHALSSNTAAHSGAVSGVSFEPGGHALASGSVDGTVHFLGTRPNYDLQRELAAPFVGQEAGVLDVVYSPDGRVLASAGRDGTIALLDGATGEQIATLAGHSAPVTSAAFSPDGGTLASGSVDNTVRLWDVRSGEPLGPPLQGHEDWILSVAFSPDGRRLASGGRDNKVILWDPDASSGQGGAQVGEALQAHDDWVYSLAFSPDGRWLASGGADNAAYLWDMTQSPPAAVPLAGHGGYVFDVEFVEGEDGPPVLYTAAEDGAIQAWDTATAGPLGGPLRGHKGAVYTLDRSADGSWLASGGLDTAVHLWPADLAAWACESAGRNLSPEEWQAALGAQPLASRLLLDLSQQDTCPQWPAGDAQ